MKIGEFDGFAEAKAAIHFRFGQPGGKHRFQTNENGRPLASRLIAAADQIGLLCLVNNAWIALHHLVVRRQAIERLRGPQKQVAARF